MVWIALIAVSMGTELADPSLAELLNSEGWKLQRTVSTEEGPIEVHKKLIQGFPCFQGRGQTTIPAEVMYRIAGDAESAIKWSSNDVRYAEVLGKKGNRVDYYQYLNVPFLSDRHWFLRGHHEDRGDHLRFHWEKLDQGGPHTERFNHYTSTFPSAVEPIINIGAWIFRPAGTVTNVRYYICTHPGGNIPDMMQSIGTERTLPNNLRDMFQEGQRRWERSLKPE